MNHSFFKSTGYVLALLLLFLLMAKFLAWLVHTAPPVTLATDGESLQRQLEIGSHQQLTTVKSMPENILGEFTTDGCSGGLSVGWEYLAGILPDFAEKHGATPPWESCCISHDQAYHSGGVRSASAEMSFEARKKADQTLKACVIATGKERSSELAKNYGLSSGEVAQLYRGIAKVMYSAVRVGGLPCTDLAWRWGYGWPKCP